MKPIRLILEGIISPTKVDIIIMTMIPRIIIIGLSLNMALENFPPKKFSKNEYSSSLLETPLRFSSSYSYRFLKYFFSYHTNIGGKKTNVST
jgi:hypothetical protein